MSANTNGSTKPPPTKSRARKRPGVDTLLTHAAKRQGDVVRVRLIKGPSLPPPQADPVDPKAPHQAFPLIAKFPLQAPDLGDSSGGGFRLYQQDVPVPVDDSDEEGAGEEAQKKPKRRWRRNARQQQTPREWKWQSTKEFLQTMIDQRSTKPAETADPPPLASSVTSFTGTPEHNPSRFVLVSVDKSNTNPDDPRLSVRLLPAPAPGSSMMVTFKTQIVRNEKLNQPLTSLAKAEHAYEDVARIQRDTTGKAHKRLFQKLEKADWKMEVLNGAGEDGVTGKDSGDKGGAKKKSASNERNSKEDNVMSDVTFRNGKGSSGRARQELLETAGDGLAVSADGVLGGANDNLFGGRHQKFNKWQGTKKNDGGGSGKNTERGADGAAMADDFYTRDVQAEYEELDYDANEQFDNDDVDVGETEMVLNDRDDDSDDDDGEDGDSEEDDEDDDEDANVTGAASLSTAAGFRAMLAKASGQETVGQKRRKVTASVDQDDEKSSHMAKILAAAEQSTKTRMQQQEQQNNDDEASPAQLESAAASARNEATVEVDENGKRVISLQAIRNEMWLNRGSMSIRSLAKIFEVKQKKSSAERKAKFREIVKELCIMKNDAVEGNILVLKQHYAKG